MCDCVWSHQCYLQPPSQCYLPRYQRYLRTTLIDSVVGNIGLVGQIFPPDRFSCSPGGHLSPFQSVFINFSWRCFNVFASRVRRCPTTISAREWSTWLCLHCCDVKSLQSYNVRFNSIHVVCTFWALFGAKAPYSLWEWNVLCRLGPGRNSPGQDNSDVRNVTRWWRYKVTRWGRYKVTRWGRCVAQSVVTTRWWTWLLQSTSPPSTLTYTEMHQWHTYLPLTLKHLWYLIPNFLSRYKKTSEQFISYHIISYHLQLGTRTYTQ